MNMSNKNFVIPNNVMELKDERFFDFVKHFSGEKVAALLEYQDINDVECLLACNDPFEILSFDSDDLLDLKKKMCIKLNSNTFIVLPGIKSKMNLIKNALMKKCNQLKKEATKTSSNIIATNNPSTNMLRTNNSLSSIDVSLLSSQNTSLSSTAGLGSEEKVKLHLIDLINDWCSKIIENKALQIFQLKETIDYEIIMDTNSSKILMKCQCGSALTLGQKNNNYILSNFIRHLKNRNPCPMIQQKLKNITDNPIVNDVSSLNNTNTSNDLTTNPLSNVTPRIQSSVEKRKRNLVLQSSLSKKKKKI